MKMYRHIGIKVFIFLLLLPFLTITDFYPFMRFGMFAEPIRSDNQLEMYYLAVKSDGRLKIQDLQRFGLSEGQFNYIARTYHHTQRDRELLDAFWTKIQGRKDSVVLLRVQGYAQDTQKVASFAP